MRKLLAIAGHAVEGLELIPLLEANPEVEIVAIYSEDPVATRARLERIDPSLALRMANRVGSDLDSLLSRSDLVAIIDAEAPPTLQARLGEALERGVQVTTPALARLLYAFGPIDATRKPDLLRVLGDILESYNLTLDRRGLLHRVLQIAVGATGADRGSLMLWDESDGRLCVEVAIGIEQELIPKIRLLPGEGIAGAAFANARAILLTGKADRSHYTITRERGDVGSAISAPLLHEGRVLGVLNVSHAAAHGAFTDEDLAFVEQLARIDAKLIARAAEYHELMLESARLRAQSSIRRSLAAREPLSERLAEICQMLADHLDGGLCQLWLRDPDLDVLVLQATSGSSQGMAWPTRVRRGEGVYGYVLEARKPVLLHDRVDGTRLCCAVLPLVTDDVFLGALSFEGAGVASEADLELLRERLKAAADTLALELAPALRSVRQQREADKTAALNELSATLASSADACSLHELIVSSAATLLEAEEAVLRVWDPERETLELVASFGLSSNDSNAPLYEVEEDLALEALSQRTALRVPDLGARSRETRAIGVNDALVQSLVSGPRVVGVLSVLGKVGDDPLCGATFTREDQRVLEHLGLHAAGALVAAGERQKAQPDRHWDALTGLPNETQLRARLDEEISRSLDRGRSLALLRMRVVGLNDALEGAQGRALEGVVQAIAEELRAQLRDFDVLARTAPDTFCMLVPEPDCDVPALVGPLARRTREAITLTAPASAPELGLEFGYASFPVDARTPAALWQAVARARIESA